MKNELTEMDIFCIEQNASRRCETFGKDQPHIYHCYPRGTNQVGKPVTSKQLCPIVEIALIKCGMTREELDRRYGSVTALHRER